MILIIGSEGSMGKRYQAILKYLNEPFECWDPVLEKKLDRAEQYKAFIVASPTQTHFRWVQTLDHYNKPILCEKPLSKNLAEVRQILDVKSPLTTMLQYSMLINSGSHDPSHYDYFRTGPDGLVWDCFQIIGLANGSVSINNQSPIWDCVINGHRLDISAMDGAYISFVKTWLSGRIKQSAKDIYDMHVKTLLMEERMNGSTNQRPDRYSSAV